MAGVSGAGASEAAGAVMTIEDALAHVRALVELETSIEQQLARAVMAARFAGADSVRLAGALGVHRATLYRRFPVVAGQ